MRNNCVYCSCYLSDIAPIKRICEECNKHVKKLDQETIDWLMTLVDNRIEKELDKHTDRYSHESSHPGYY